MVSSRTANKPPRSEDRIRPASLSKDHREQLDQEIAARLQQAGLQPYQQSAVERHAGKSRPYTPDLSRRWIFPTIARVRGLQTAATLVAASKGNDLSQLRLLTLRVGGVKPAPERLGKHLTLLSGAINKSVPYLAQLKLIAPVLSVPHIRLDQNGDLDIHLHALWHVRHDKIGEVQARLKPHFQGVWIDEDRIQSVWEASFYMASGVLDYPTVPHWPLEILRAVWGLDHHRMIRPAGWYAAYIKALNANGSEKRQQARQRLSGSESGPGEGRGYGRHQDPPQIATGQGGGMSEHGEAEETSTQPTHDAGPYTPFYTVRSVVPEPSYFDPSLAPTVDDLWIALHVVEGRMVEPVAETFADICHRLSLSPAVAHRSIGRVEDHLRTSLFFPGGDWTPTDSSRDFMRAGRPILQALDTLAVSLGLEAAWAGFPGRSEFEKRIGVRRGDGDPDR